MHNNIAKRRTEIGVSQTQLAERAGISRPYLSCVERGEATPTVAVAAKLAEVLGCTIDELFGEEDR